MERFVDDTNANAQADEEWYLRIDDNQYGPISRSQMEFFLRPPRLCRFMQVMCTLHNGVWQSISHTETLDEVLLRFGIQNNLPSAAKEVAPTAGFAALFNGVASGTAKMYAALAAWICVHQLESWLVVAVIAVNALLLTISSDGLNRERRIFTKVEAIWADVGTTDPEQESAEEWRELADAAITELNPLLDELAHSRRTTEAHQRLLFICREQLLPILKSPAPSITDSKQAFLLEEQLTQLRTLLTSAQ